MAKEPSIWLIAMIDHKKIYNLFGDMRKKPSYKAVEAYIPTVKVLKKQVKGKKFFEEVPLMLNYGFFKVPLYFVPNSHLLTQMKSDISCIYSWLIDPQVTKNKHPYFTFHKLHNPLGVAMTPAKVIRSIKKTEERQTIYTEADLDTLYPGKMITLQCYPFDGLAAEIVSIDRDRKEVAVTLLLDTPLIKNSKIKVSFENIFFTRYVEDYIDGPMREESIEEINSRHNNINNVLMRDGNEAE